MPNVTRRERLRAEAISAIKATAREHLRAVGAANLSLRRIAGDLQMSPAGLYRYYASRDDLLTSLITDAFVNLAETVAAARDSATGPGARLLASASAYRQWAIDHPEEFGLIFGNPLPGYAAPADGPTQIAARSVGAIFFAEIERACADGAIAVRPAASDPGVDASLRVFAQTVAPQVPKHLLPAVHGLWGHMHGLTILEVFHHMPWLIPDGQTLFMAEMRRALAELGIALD